ncbi:MAG: TonB-dependent receptor [Bacteroidales bacterium]
MNCKTTCKTILAGTLLLMSVCLPAYNQTRISGFVRDKQSGERLIGANILMTPQKGGTTSDNNGYFSLVVRIPCILRISYVGYKPADLELTSRKDTLIEANLEPGQELEAIVITAARRPIANMAILTINELRELPSLGGKPDVLKSMQLLPGIQAQNEGSSLLLVRGGDPGQNLYLFDNVPVIYVNHLGGFMSVFNPDIINSIDLYKGGFPARYGGRLSSIVDITQREGDHTALKGSLGIGVTDVSFSIEGPTKLRNSSFILTGRKTLTDPLMALFTWASEANDFIMGYGFHDLNGKFTWKPNERNSLHLNLYQGDDYINYRTSNKTLSGSDNGHLRNVWGNWLASGRWNRVLSPRVFMTNTLSYSRYRLNFFQSYSVTDTIKHPVFDRNYLSSVQDFSLRSNVKVQVLKAWSLETGLQASSLTHIPNSYYQSSLAVQPAIEKIKALESALYLDNKINLAAWLEANLGLRIVYYGTAGFKTVSLEPRARLSFKMSADQYLHLSYQRVTQNEQLLFTAGSIMNSEVWVPAGEKIGPSWSEQYTFGWNGSFLNGQYTTEITVYFKTMNQLATYQEGYNSLMGDTEWRNKVITGGTGRSAGVEFLLKKQLGAWTGFVSYAWSKTTRQFPQINKGNEYVFDFDRPHTASLNISHKFNDKWSFNLVWLYQTGLPYTPVLGRQLTLNTEPDQNGNFGYYEVLLYGERNSARMKDYHRLDIGVTLNTHNWRGRKVIWTFSVYNLYNRHNPYYYYYNTTANNTDYDRPEHMTAFKPMNLYQMSFFPIIPSVSYKVFFDGPSEKRVKKHSGEGVSSRISHIKNRWNIKAGYASIPGVNFRIDGGMKRSFGNFRLETNYHLLNFLEIGGYLGYSRYSSYVNSQNIIMSYENTPFIGLNINVQLLPLIVRNPASKFDIYLLGRYGGAYFSSPQFHFYVDKGFFLNYSHGAGIAFYLTKHIGVFSEFSFTALDIKFGNLRYGLSVKF